ncbi:MAG: helicase-related protein [Acidimicrobiales bacterium]
MTFAPGHLVKARAREWVVLPGSDDHLILVRPLGGTADESTGILAALETIDPATFAWPDPTRPGDHRSAQLLRNALRLGFRSSAGPFRSFGSIAVEPRPYQLVPLLMSLRMDPIRLLIADDTGIGKSIEAGLIAAEALATGNAECLAVLCPPHLAEQWQRELSAKFHIDAELVLPSTAPRLERGCAVDQTLFDIHPHVIVSTDFIKTDRRRNEFLRTCPELVIIDEAHTCAADDSRRSARHQRHRLVAGLAGDPTRHLVLVTATPHSGKIEAFRSLLSLLDPVLAQLPDDLAGHENRPARRLLANHLVQRRRPDIRHFLDEDTPFPRREEAEATYALHPDYRKLFDRALAYARESVRDASGSQHRRRVRWWSALALLRSLASSPAAAAATLRARAETTAAATVEDVDAVGRRSILDAGDDEAIDGIDVVPGAIPTLFGEDDEDETADGRVRRRLLDMARQAEALLGDNDVKLHKAVELVAGLVADGFNPIVFCRFIPTAEYVAAALRDRLGGGVAVAAVTGTVAHTEREQRVVALGTAPKRVLVATDCLSEGINLQEHFDAVLHYDLAWAPTRHEQREGRVDRYGQPSPLVRVLTYYGVDNQIDGIVLDVLIRKHRAIQMTLGIAVPVPAASGDVLEAIFEGVLLRDRTYNPDQLSLFDGSDVSEPRRAALHTEWEDAAEREKRSQTMFAQHAIKVDEVARELAAAREAVGAAGDVETFVRATVSAYGGTVHSNGNGAVEINLRDTPPSLRDLAGGVDRLRARFTMPVRDGEVYLTRTHPFVEGLAAQVLDSALDALGEGTAARCGVVRTASVARRTTFLLVRYRFDVVTVRGDDEQVLLAEDSGILAFEGAPEDPTWLGPDAARLLLDITPAGNIAAEQASRFLAAVVDQAHELADQIDTEAARRAEELLAAHRRVRSDAGVRGIRYRVTPHLPADVLGVYILLPPASTGSH